MKSDHASILKVLDDCCMSYNFPMLDNGYVYLAASRLSLFRSEMDWAMVIEIFGYSPRSGLPDLHVHTFSSNLHARNAPGSYVTSEAHQDYLKNNPNNESRFFYPIEEGEWIDSSDSELLASSGNFVLRGKSRPLPSRQDYSQFEVQLEHERPAVFEFCRYLGASHRSEVLGVESERRVSVLPEMQQVLVLDEWCHPDVAAGHVPSELETFQQLAHVLVAGDLSLYKPTESANSHWSNWPEGGSL